MKIVTKYKILGPKKITHLDMSSQEFEIRVIQYQTISIIDYVGESQFKDDLKDSRVFINCKKIQQII